MKTKPAQPPIRPEPDEHEIRQYAHHLYEVRGRVPGRELDDWLEARACLAAGIPWHHAHPRRHRPLPPPADAELCAAGGEARNLAR